MEVLAMPNFALFKNVNSFRVTAAAKLEDYRRAIKMLEKMVNEITQNMKNVYNYIWQLQNEKNGLVKRKHLQIKEQQRVGKLMSISHS